jgi:hypothetical protein
MEAQWLGIPQTKELEALAFLRDFDDVNDGGFEGEWCHSRSTWDPMMHCMPAKNMC